MLSCRGRWRGESNKQGVGVPEKYLKMVGGGVPEKYLKRGGGGVS